MELSGDEPSPRRAPGAPPFLDAPSPGDGGGGGGGGGVRVSFLARVANISPADLHVVDATAHLGADEDLVCGDVTRAEFRAIEGSAWLCGSAVEALCAMINHVYSSQGGRKRIRVYGGLFLGGNANALGEHLDRVAVTRPRFTTHNPFDHDNLIFFLNLSRLHWLWAHVITTTRHILVYDPTPFDPLGTRRHVAEQLQDVPAAKDPFLHLTLRYYGLRARRALSCARMFPPVVSPSATRPSCNPLAIP